MLKTMFERAHSEGRATFIPYVMTGDPDVETTAAVLRALAESGADAIELGIPFSDPLADGPSIAAAGQRSLEGGTTTPDVLELLRRFRAESGVPVVLFTYFNPVYQYGIERFALDAVAAGASGVIVPDLALEESEALRTTLAAHGLDMPLLVAPSTTPQRAELLARATSGFVYVVSRLGVTGAATAPAIDAVRRQIALLRGFTSVPLAVGFGISTVEHVRLGVDLADGIIVGSAIIDAYHGLRGEAAGAAVRAFVAPLIEATHNIVRR